MVNLVIVSHSARLGEGVGELARQMLMNDGCKLAIAAGIDDPDSPIGTDPIKVMEAIESVADTDHVLVMMDIGSALLSAETASICSIRRLRRRCACAPRRWSKGRWRPRSAPPPAPGSTK
jgi:dihydroxyacetone kinase DhaKLM complex PTS-EIIA-like component DhaM